MFMNISLQLSIVLCGYPWIFMDIPGRTVLADIRSDIRKIKDVLVELSVHPRISVLNRAPISVEPISARIAASHIEK